jgi:hypothetical protein
LYNYLKECITTTKAGVLMKYSPISPSFPCKVFVFPIGKMKRENIKEETRKYWNITKKYQDTTEYEYAVGVEKGYSVSAYKLTKWKLTKDVRYVGKYEFEGDEFPDFKGFSWKKQIETTGYWNHGNHLVVEFDGNGKFKLERPDKPIWFDCCYQDNIQSSSPLDSYDDEKLAQKRETGIIVKKNSQKDINTVREETKK